MSNDTEITPLQKYLDKKIMRVSEFSRISKIPPGSLYNIVKGTRSPCRWLALKIVNATDGELSLQDFGYKN